MHVHASWQKLVAFFWLQSQQQRIIRLGLLLLIGGLLLHTLLTNTPSSIEAPAPLRVVQLTSVNALTTDDTAIFVGTVRAAQESDMQFEIGGRVTTVPISVGQYVTAGTIIAAVENSAQRAAVLQAEGAYEAAKANAAVSELSVSDAERGVTTAEQNVLTVLQSTHTTTNVQVRSVLDQFFSNGDSLSPSLSINGYGRAVSINENRKALHYSLIELEKTVNNLEQGNDFESTKALALQNISDALSLTDALTVAVSKASASDTLNGQSVTAYIPALANVRNTLVAQRNAVDNAFTTLATATAALEKARLAATGVQTPSIASASLTQALGVLRAAQSQLEKTIVRAPFSGSVDVLRVRIGEYIQPNVPVALITGSSGLEISLYVGDTDATQFYVGQSVLIEGTKEGRVKSISSAPDPLTLKREVVIITDDTMLASGDTVQVTPYEPATTTATLRVPLETLKLDDTNASLLTVNSEGTTIALPVTLGQIQGNWVVITDGITATSTFIRDVRGIAVGQKVQVNQ